MVARKDPAARARKNPERVPFKVMELEAVPQPPLPAYFPWEGKKLKWPQQTVDWWEHWKDSALNEGFLQHDWDYLLDTAILHAKHWLGLDAKAAGELRQRQAKFGVTPEDRARLRIIVVSADNAEEAKRVREEADRLNQKIAMRGNRRRLTGLSADVG
ncbi:minor tail protein [Mycobacterium phage FF47]|uniref:Terminase small subunit n=3 Tax=Mapvirus TaxID=1920750 RepID=S5Y5A7_9CAUD|nr:minor tail protein [Mycobacterium phage FF47]YP_010731529.1 terminase small subunit [Mycobacterium phage Muddy]AGI12272.1 hypothetical protein FF47_04 [Mycobacterium phage FF47]WEV84048.1 terminase small subunit [Mycobacterium phage Muddy]